MSVNLRGSTLHQGIGNLLRTSNKGDFKFSAYARESNRSTNAQVIGVLSRATRL